MRRRSIAIFVLPNRLRVQSTTRSLSVVPAQLEKEIPPGWKRSLSRQASTRRYCSRSSRSCQVRLRPEPATIAEQKAAASSTSCSVRRSVTNHRLDLASRVTSGVTR